MKLWVIKKLAQEIGYKNMAAGLGTIELVVLSFKLGFWILRKVW